MDNNKKGEVKLIHIVDGNTKMKNTANISLPPIIACGKNSFYCKDQCYAKKFYRMYPEVKKAWDDNLCIVLSIWPNLDTPYRKMPLAFIDFKNETRGKDSFKCPESCEECRACWFLKYGENVLLTIKRK